MLRFDTSSSPLFCIGQVATIARLFISFFLFFYIFYVEADTPRYPLTLSTSEIRQWSGSGFRSVPVVSSLSVSGAYPSSWARSLLRPDRVRVTGVTVYLPGSRTSVGLDIDGPDQLAPIHDFSGDEFPEAGRRAGKHDTLLTDPPQSVMVGNSSPGQQHAIGSSETARVHHVYRGCGCSPGRVAYHSGTALSDAANPLDLRVCRRGPERHSSTIDRAVAVGAPRPTVRRGEPARRREQYRDRGGPARSRRWLHAPHRHFREYHQCDALRQAQL
jgi:hypothetical protein